MARFLAGVVGKWRTAGEVRVALVNGGRGLVLRVHDRLRGVIAVGTGPGQVRSVFIVMNPDKLGPG